jgi:hypothetical protein
MSFSGGTAAAAAVTGLSNTVLDTTPNLVIESGSSARTRCVCVAAHPHIRAVIERRDNIATTATAQLFARLGVTGNDALDFAPYAAPVVIPAGAVGTVTVYDIPGVSAADVMIKITDTSAPPVVADSSYRVYFGATAS